MGKLCQPASLLKTYIRIRHFPGTFQNNNNIYNIFEHTVLAQIYSSQSLGGIVNIVLLVDATKVSGWKIEFHTWHSVPIPNAKYWFCHIISFIFLTLQIKFVLSYIYSKAYIPLCSMG